MAHDLVARRAELVRHSDHSRLVRRRAAWVGAIGGAAGIAVRFAGLATPGLIILVVAVVCCGAGIWITSGHIAEFRREIHSIDHPDRDRRVRRVR